MTFCIMRHLDMSLLRLCQEFEKAAGAFDTCTIEASMIYGTNRGPDTDKTIRAPSLGACMLARAWSIKLGDMWEVFVREQDASITCGWQNGTAIK